MLTWVVLMAASLVGWFAAPLPTDCERVLPVAWSRWPEPDTYEVWGLTADLRPRVLAGVPISPSLDRPELAWEDAGHLRVTITANGGGAMSRRVWRIDTCGHAELVLAEVREHP
ncbi:MAG: hypothetical protein IT298_03810 [Chloroflexi bacterium]|nr:hypothetical protein [Chloroflexota bacterium]